MSRVEKTTSRRLSVSFPQTFAPERRLLFALLKFAAGGGRGDIQEISAATGIPTGKSSGKVDPVIGYCSAMGLISLNKSGGAKEPILTDFGRAVFLSDPYFQEEITQWLCHLNLCSRETGAEVWYRLFWEGVSTLPSEFSREDLADFIARATGSKSKRIWGPLTVMYREDISFAKCGALVEEDKRFSLKKMPVRRDFAPGYTAFFIDRLEKIAPLGEQVTLSVFEENCGLSAITGWSLLDRERVMEMVESRGAITVDRHMRPWILKARITAKEAWRNLFAELV